MRITTALLKLKQRLAETVGAETQEYALNSLMALAIVTVLLKIVQSDAFKGLLEGLLGLLFNLTPSLVSLFK